MFSLFKKKSREKAAPLVVPRIKHTNFLEALDKIPGMTGSSRPIAEPLVGDLLLTYAIDLGPSYVSVSPSLLEEHGLGLSDLRPLAEMAALNAMRSLRVGTDGTVYEMTADDNMAACSILFPELWREIEGEIGGPAVVAFPHRDVVLYTRLDLPDAVENLKGIVAEVDFDETHALSRLLYERSKGEWCVAGR